MEKQNDILNKATGALKNEQVPTDPPQNVVDSTIARLTTAEPVRFRLPERRRTMKMFTKIAAVAVIISAVIVGIGYLGIPINGTGLAFAEVIETFQKKGYTFTYSVEVRGKTTGTGKGMVLEPGLIRWTISEGPFRDLFLVIDTINNRMLWVNRDGMIIGDVKRPENSQRQFLQKPIEALWNLRDGSEENLGKKEMDDKEVTGFRVHKEQKKGVFDIMVWAEEETGLPIEVEIIGRESTNGPESIRILLRDFKFDVEMNASLFGVAPADIDRPDETGKLIILPGVGIGQLRFGMTIKQMKEILGEPDFTIGDNVVFQYPGFAITAREQKIYSIACGSIGDRNSPQVALCKCRTPEGITIGSSKADIIAVYGEPTVKKQSNLDKQVLELGYRKIPAMFYLYDDKVFGMVFQEAR